MTIRLSYNKTPDGVVKPNWLVDVEGDKTHEVNYVYSRAPHETEHHGGRYVIRYEKVTLKIVADVAMIFPE